MDWRSEPWRALGRHQLGAVVATGVDFAAMIFSVEALGVTPVVGTGAGAALGAVTSFALSRACVFRAHSGHWAVQASRYALVSVVSAGLNMLGEHLVHDSARMQYVLARVLVSIVISVAWNFPMQRRFVFRDRSCVPPHALSDGPSSGAHEPPTWTSGRPGSVRSALSDEGRGTPARIESIDSARKENRAPRHAQRSARPHGSASRGPARHHQARPVILVPQGMLRSALRVLDCVAANLVRAGVTANAVTLSSLALAAAGAVLLCMGFLGAAGLVMAVASLGDAIDGLIARRTRSASVGSALLDASVDRYEEFLFLGSLAIYLRASAAALVVVLGALVGSFMVSYGSAKAEALGVAVPPGVMRRAERAICLCLGVASTPVFGWLAARGVVPGWAARAPLFAALGLVAVVANISAVRRLRLLAESSRGPVASEPSTLDAERVPARP